VAAWSWPRLAWHAPPAHYPPPSIVLGPISALVLGVRQIILCCDRAGCEVDDKVVTTDLRVERLRLLVRIVGCGWPMLCHHNVTVTES
jgi:hypothetical protein